MELFIKNALKSDRMKMMPIRNQTRATQRMTFKDNEAKIGEHKEQNTTSSSAEQMETWTDGTF
ncbi:hypothetical protein NPIL_699771, partial [Nephila pilipes]